MIKQIEKILIDIIAYEMDLPQTYGKDSDGNDIPVFMIGYADAALSTTEQLQIAVQNMNIDTIANNKKYNAIAEESEQYLTAMQTIQIDVMSKNTDARTRCQEILLALNSIYSTQQQEKYQIKLNINNTGFVNVSQAEGGFNINRFAMTITCFCWYTKTKSVNEYFNQFEIQVDNEQTISENKSLIDIDYNTGV